MKRLKYGTATLVLATAGLFLVACGTNSSPSKPSESASVNKSKDTSTFTYAISGDPASTNPINASDRWGLTVSNIIYSPLMTVEPDGKQKNVLAESIEPSADGLSILVKLKKDIKWSDGQPLTADDVVFTYTQKAKKENNNADKLWIGDKPITTQKVDDHTVKFVLPAPSASAVNNITTETFIIPEHAYKNISDFSVKQLPVTPVGTGPYKLKEYKTGQYLTFEANEHYFGGAPAIKNLTLRIIESTDTAKVALQKGEVDAAVVLPSDISDLDAKKITVHPYSETRIGYLGLNTKLGALANVKVRQAIFYALDKSELNRAAYLSDKYYSTPYSFLPPSNPYVTKDVEKYKTDIDKSKALLSEAGASNVNLNIAFSSTDPAQKIQATLIQQQLKKVGISVTLEGSDATAIYAELKKPNTTKYNLFLGGYIMGNDPDLYAALFKTNGSSNYFKTDNAKTDQLFNEGAVELNEAKREKIYDKLQKEISEDARIYPIVDNKKILAVNNRITNIKQANLVPIYTFEDISKLKIK